MYKALIENPKRKKILERPRPRGDDYIKIELRVTEWEGIH
jgi:hypothetical protein